jgi:hypothetical protein
MEVEDVDSDSDSECDSDDSECDSDNSVSEEKDEMEEEFDFVSVMLFLCSYGTIFNKEKSSRKKHVKKTAAERLAPWVFIETWTDSMFHRQFRMFRQEFFGLLKRMVDAFQGPFDSGAKNYEYSCKQGDNSWGACIPLQIKLCVTLRILAGASYLDMIWYGCSVNHVEAFFVDMLKLINLALPDSFIFNFNADTDFNEMAYEWSRVMIKARSWDLMKGTILAGDGLVIQTEGLSAAELLANGLDDLAFRNRKGYFGLIVQAFCDAFGMFRYFELSWPGATPDITAYKQTALYRMFTSGVIPNAFHMVLDEAYYSSIGGDQHLTPYSKAQLLKARSHSEMLYRQMKSFNNCLSSQRITIERAFGMLVRKFGILWRALRYDLKTNVLVVKTCAKLHNWCLRAWKMNGTRSTEVHDIETGYAMFQDEGIFCGWDNDQLLDPDNNVPDDDEIIAMMANLFPPPAGTRANRVDSSRRINLVRHIFSHASIFSVRSDSVMMRGESPPAV